MASNQRSTTSPQESNRSIARIALYARVSTLNNQDPEMQLTELREYAARRGWLVSQEYVDHGVSGSQESRPALNLLMSDAKRRRFDAILVWKIDRFGRSLKHLVNALAELAALGIAFVSLRDNLDLSTPSGRLIDKLNSWSSNLHLLLGALCPRTDCPVSRRLKDLEYAEEHISARS